MNFNFSVYFCIISQYLVAGKLKRNALGLLDF